MFYFKPDISVGNWFQNTSMVNNNLNLLKDTHSTGSQRISYGNPTQFLIISHNYYKKKIKRIYIHEISMYMMVFFKNSENDSN